LAPPEITRDPELELMRDERGPVGLLLDDLKYGLALIGATGVGKSTEMAWTIKNDARDRDAAMIVADIKEDTAKLALELIPEDRKEIVERLRHRPGLGAVERYWRNTFPERWMDSRTHMAGQLAAPLNKIGRLLATPSVDLALRHPFALDISRLIRERQVLIVS